MERFKFYSINDASIDFYWGRIKKVMKNVESNDHPIFLDVLEFYNINKILKNDIYLSEFSKEQIKKIRGSFNKKINIFFSSLTKENIIYYLECLFSVTSNTSIENYHNPKDAKNTDIDSNSTFFRADFLECFEKFQLDKKITESDLKNIINRFSIPIWYFLKSDYFSIRYPKLIKTFFLSNTENFELFLSNYIVNNDNYVIPDNISTAELYNLCEWYIDESSNLNYLRLINQGIKDIQRLVIDAKLKLKAQRKIEQLEKVFLNSQSKKNSNGFLQSVAIYTDRKKYLTSEKSELKILIDVDDIKTHSSFESLLNYLMYMDYFFNENWILNLGSFPNFESSTLTRLFYGPKTRKNYETSFYFHNKDLLVKQAFKGFQHILDENLGLRIEDLINYFFEKYCENNFEIEWLPIRFAGEKEKINIQTKNLFTIEEQIRKQWNLLIDEGEIDKDLFALESTPRIYDLGSFLHKKYIYLNEENKDIKKVLELLFSDQSHLNTVKVTDGYLHENSFIQLLEKHNINYSFFENYQRQDINYLIENNIITKRKDDVIYVNKKQMRRIRIFSMIFNYGVINYYNGLTKISRKVDLKQQQNEIDEILEEGLLIYKDTLFSKPESDYLNYLLNDSEFDNALGIRNKYLHGSVFEDNVEDLLYALIILTIYVIKINEELILNKHYDNKDK
ncbi:MULTISPECIES: hypothetical protein [Pediococcus]|uniref:Uncharacterized protein n=1 Tax=Pediococcus pentosaceus (strain ATCC 25745 / CCUG 21536 / LMG 10740 / 183-1w) TaxID=278197 RepID=Q03FJ2_PEDPA|nr:MULTISPECIES: hypothetical protein [Pediococcus]ABJ68030.1 hypothetical protein PEPE_0974 [Pediococcus pentosaceus ATCC 25745]KAF5441035.1 hypothetical protein HFC69_01945 [Pediococcus sp. EKM202D]KAF5441402.1 hypothetical protein HFC68_00935 [Pediococcus sp. EKM201D]QHM64431.1 hypothetical protein C7M48_00134 [Pediococcus pentosaceus]QHM66149.1 hypothetical protein C7M49_00046 [Pediococcus pentosaceus]